jgi:hypothetical protein
LATVSATGSVIAKATVSLALTTEETSTLSDVEASGCAVVTAAPIAGALRPVMLISAQVEAVVEIVTLEGRWWSVRCSSRCAVTYLPAGIPLTANFRYETVA